ITVSVVILPARAHGLVAEAAQGALNLMAAAVPVFLSGLTSAGDAAEVRRRHEGIRKALNRLDAVAEEARRERVSRLADEPNEEPIPRTLLRLRSDFVIMTRAATMPLPEVVA